ncbi:MAG: heme-copper oxidase subunit III [Magnetococcales bacterium]|nr:heme-copper oxidase subunit III [Magnetococcales bacterium]
MSQTTAGHAHHWETSWAPLAAVLGIFLILVMGFSQYFVYHNTLMTIIFAGIGTPILLAGLARWVSEGLTQKAIIPGLAIHAIPVFIVSEVFIFLGFFSTYWTMRLSAPSWPPAGTPEHINLVLPLIMTAILVSSSFTIHVAEEKLEHNDMGGFRSWLMLTIALGAVFLGCTIYEYSHLLHAGFGPSTNSYSTAFYSITGFHASHVLVGLGIFIAVLLPALGGKTNKTFLGVASVYWHFVDIVWFFVISQVYYW